MKKDLLNVVVGLLLILIVCVFLFGPALLAEVTENSGFYALYVVEGTLFTLGISWLFGEAILGG